MKFRLSLFAFLTCALSLTTSLSAQHAGDIEFGYNNLTTPTAFEIEAVDLTSDGLMYFEGDFESLDPFTPTDLSANEPGFTTVEDEGLLVNAGDEIFLRAVDATVHSGFGVGYVNYYNPTTDTLEAVGRIGILDNSTGTSDLVLGGTGIESGDLQQFLGIGDADGDVHDHLIFDLLDDGTAPVGAYGLMLQLQSDFASADGTMDLTSDAFWVVLNHGMTESDFENNALPAFGVSAVPEPSSMALLIFGATVVGVTRRKRNQA